MVKKKKVWNYLIEFIKGLGYSFLIGACVGMLILVPLFTMLFGYSSFSKVLLLSIMIIFIIYLVNLVYKLHLKIAGKKNKELNKNSILLDLSILILTIVVLQSTTPILQPKISIKNHEKTYGIVEYGKSYAFQKIDLEVEAPLFLFKKGVCQDFRLGNDIDVDFRQVFPFISVDEVEDKQSMRVCLTNTDAAILKSFTIPVSYKSIQKLEYYISDKDKSLNFRHVRENNKSVLISESIYIKNLDTIPIDFYDLEFFTNKTSSSGILIQELNKTCKRDIVGYAFLEEDRKFESQEGIAHINITKDKIIFYMNSIDKFQPSEPREYVIKIEGMGEGCLIDE